ncbi:MAG: helix-turn-helix transcriptional regulator [Actinobacteria bacterium]|nr:helix-turn-helix transcriptional regulator [Actinomycetota bacterium]
MVQYQDRLDRALAAISDPTRRSVLERLAGGPASISELADPFDISLTGMKKHVAVLEEAELVSTEKVGRVRMCRLGPRGLDEAQEWIEAHGRAMAARLDRLGTLLENDDQGEQR